MTRKFDKKAAFGFQTYTVQATQHRGQNVEGLKERCKWEASEIGGAICCSFADCYTNNLICQEIR